MGELIATKQEVKRPEKKRPKSSEKLRGGVTLGTKNLVLLTKVIWVGLAVH